MKTVVNCMPGITRNSFDRIQPNNMLSGILHKEGCLCHTWEGIPLFAAFTAMKEVFEILREKPVRLLAKCL